MGRVLDMEMTMLDKQSKSVPIDEQANDDVVHLDRFREADRLPDQTNWLQVFRRADASRIGEGGR